MNDTTTIELKDIDSEDISDVLLKVEKSFNFKFYKTELKDVKTFGELCDIITDKIQGDSLHDCTTQQAFYKIRSAIAATLVFNSSSITPETNLQNVFPRHSRRRQIGATENLLGFKTEILRPKQWISVTLAIILIFSLILLPFYWKLALAGLLLSILGFKLAFKFGNELDIQTVGQLADKFSRENYKNSRRNPETVNRGEIAKKIKDLFCNDLELPGTALTREATFV